MEVALRGSSQLTGRIMVSTMIVALGGLLFGFDTAVISGTTSTLQRVFHLSDLGLGFTVAIGLIGTVFGSVLAGSPSNRFGRKPVLFAVAVLFFVASLGCAVAWSWLALVVSRFLGGVAVGAASVLSPLYIAEIAPPQLRGRLVGVGQFNVVCGILIAYLSNWAINHWAIDLLPADQSWRWMLGVQMIPAGGFFVLLLFVAESPRWYVQKGRLDDALQVFRSLGESDPEARIAEIKESLHMEIHQQNEPLFKRCYSLPILATIMVATFNQLSGINALIYYASDIFTMAGAQRASALLQSVIIGGTNLAFTMLGMALIDYLGRKILLIIGGIGTSACLAGVAWAFYCHDSGGAIVLAGLIGFIAFFALSQGAVIWVFISEVFPNRVRSKGQALGSFTHWAWAAIVSGTFPILVGKGGTSPWCIFAFFSIMTMLQAVLVWRLLPETKGYSLEQIQKRLGIA